MAMASIILHIMRPRRPWTSSRCRRPLNWGSRPGNYHELLQRDHITLSRPARFLRAVAHWPGLQQWMEVAGDTSASLPAPGGEQEDAVGH